MLMKVSNVLGKHVGQKYVDTGKGETEQIETELTTCPIWDFFCQVQNFIVNENVPFTAFSTGLNI